MSFTVYQAARGFLPELTAELSRCGLAFTVRDPLVLVPGPPQALAWAQNVWVEPQYIPVDSIGDAARKLRAIQRNWALCPVGLHRRAELIRQKLPKVTARPYVFGDPLPSAALGAWTLWEEKTVLASTVTSSPFPNGEWNFLENKTDPPNRAYLKLWEALSRIGERPGPGQLCLDLGGSPGGWTWVLASLGARVFTIDKAPLDPKIARLPGVEFCAGSAFGLEPRAAGAVDWLFSDVICYPERLVAMIRRWLAFGECRRFVCTVKLQGEADAACLDELAAIPGSTLVHLCNNKHELTWINLNAPLQGRTADTEEDGEEENPGQD